MKSQNQRITNHRISKVGRTSKTESNPLTQHHLVTWTHPVVPCTPPERGAPAAPWAALGMLGAVWVSAVTAWFVLCSDSPHSEPGTIDEVDHDNGTEPHTSDDGEQELGTGQGCAAAGRDG